MTAQSREYIKQLCQEYGGRIPVSVRKQVEIETGYSKNVIYYDMIYALSETDDRALRTIVRRRWSTQNGRVRRYGVSENLDFGALLNLFIFQGGKCASCGNQNGRAHLEIEHKIPIAKGGEHHIDNIELICTFCNMSRMSKQLTKTERI